MKKNRAKKDILYISISSFILVVIWVSSNLYHAYVTSTIAADLQLQIVPIAPTFNTDIIQKIRPRKTVTPVFELTNNASSEAVVSPTPVASESQTPAQNNTPLQPNNATLP